MSKYLNLGNELFNLLDQRFCDGDGRLCRNVDCGKGIILDSRSQFDEIGDFAQYIYLLGVEVESDHMKSWAKNQVSLVIKDFQADDGSIRTAHSSILFNDRFRSLIRIGDIFWGLAELYSLSHEQFVRQSFDRLIDSVEKNFLIDGLPSYGNVYIFDKSFSLPICEPMTSGYITESALVMFEATGDFKYLSLSQQIVDRWMQTLDPQWATFFRFTKPSRGTISYAVLDQQFKLRGRPGLQVSTQTKGDVYLNFAVLRLWEITGESRYLKHLYRWHEFVRAHLLDKDGKFKNFFDKKTKRSYDVKLEYNHSIIELLIALAHKTKDQRFLELAAASLKGWLKSSREFLLNANQPSDGHFELDPNLDITINLLKMNDITKDRFWLEESRSSFDRIIDAFGAPYGYYERIGRKGETYKNTDTKYLGLLIKGFLCFHYSEIGRFQLDDNVIRNLSSDR